MKLKWCAVPALICWACHPVLHHQKEEEAFEGSTEAEGEGGAEDGPARRLHRGFGWLIHVFTQHHQQAKGEIKRHTRQPSLFLGRLHHLAVETTKNVISFVLVFLYQSLADITKGDMKAADELVDEDDDLHLSEEDDDEADKMSLASDLDDEDMEEVAKKQEELEKKNKKKK